MGFAQAPATVGFVFGESCQACQNCACCCLVQRLPPTRAHSSSGGLCGKSEPKCPSVSAHPLKAWHPQATHIPARGYTVELMPMSCYHTGCLGPGVREARGSWPTNSAFLPLNRLPVCREGPGMLQGMGSPSAVLQIRGRDYRRRPTRAMKGGGSCMDVRGTLHMPLLANSWGSVRQQTFR